ncbi:MAG: peptide chain release factor N(5)-glutamine methyltransferase [Brevinematales bacterium]|nr:peptide chain release factor N(5)-glutamine methyltransferase [Brevinematales bacterium]
MTAGEIYEYASGEFEHAGIPTPKTDAGILIAHGLGLERIDIFLRKDEKLGIFRKSRIMKMIRRRLAFEPVAYIIGYRYFYLDKFKVDPTVLIPRCDTEHIIYTAETLGKERGGFRRILDIGAGSGAITVSLAKLFPDAAVIGIDLFTGTAERNIKALGASNAYILRQDVMELEPSPGTKFDLIASNPPYLSDEDMEKLSPEVRDYEPADALYGGPDGMDFYRRIADIAGGLLTDDGVILLETDFKWEQVSEIFAAKGFFVQQPVKDYNHFERVLVVRKTLPES